MTSLPAPPATHLPPTFVPSLVGIRGALSIVVVLVHLAPFAIAMIPATAAPLYALWHHGYIALDLFFVLSGFVISAGYRSRFASWPGLKPFGRFLWARLSRFYPLHLAVLAAMVGAVLASRAIGREIPHSGDLGWDLVRQVTLTSGWGGADSLSWNGPVWSLSAEWFCYLLVPFVLFPLAARCRTPATCVVGYLAACAFPLAVYAAIGFDDGTITYGMPLPRALGGFLAGAMLWQLTRTGSRLPAVLGRFTGLVVLASLVTIVVVVAVGLPVMAAVVVVGLIVPALAQRRGAIDRVLSTRTALVGGEYSVALFLVHVPFQLAAGLVINEGTFPGAWGVLGTVLLFLGAFPLAWAGYVLVERPAAAWMKARAAPPKVEQRPSADASPAAGSPSSPRG